MSDQLKPCPRCGGECLSQSVFFPTLTNYRTLIYCDKCGLQSGYFDTEQEAIDWWNDRKQVDHDAWVEEQKEIQRKKGKTT